MSGISNMQSLLLDVWVQASNAADDYADCAIRNVRVMARNALTIYAPLCKDRNRQEKKAAKATMTKGRCGNQESPCEDRKPHR